MRLSALVALAFVVSGCASLMGPPPRCAADIQKFCSNVDPNNNPATGACLREHFSELQPRCVARVEEVEFHLRQREIRIREHQALEEAKRKYLLEHPELAILIEQQEMDREQRQQNALRRMRLQADQQFYQNMREASDTMTRAFTPTPTPKPVQTECNPSGWDGRGFSCTTQ